MSNVELKSRVVSKSRDQCSGRSSVGPDERRRLCQNEVSSRQSTLIWCWRRHHDQNKLLTQLVNSSFSLNKSKIKPSCDRTGKKGSFPVLSASLRENGLYVSFWGPFLYSGLKTENYILLWACLSLGEEFNKVPGVLRAKPGWNLKTKWISVLTKLLNFTQKTNSKHQMDGHVVSLFLGEILHPDADVSDWL